MTSNRDSTIDFFRFIGISAIILAHCDTPWQIFELRNFDIPLMVFISGYCAVQFSQNTGKFGAYVKDRFLRLVVPTWIFLSFYFSILFFLGHPQSPNDIIESYFFVGGPVGVWIIRIFFFMSLLTPAIIYLLKKIHLGAFFLILLLLVNEVIVLYSKSLPASFLTSMFSILFVFNLSYGCVLFTGAVWEELEKKERLGFLIFFLLIFLSYFTYLSFRAGNLVLIQSCKNPPSLYYLSYGLFVTICLFFSKRFSLFQKMSKNRFITFIGSHSLWIYLWHWVYLFLYDNLLNMGQSWMVKFVFVFGFASTNTFIQVGLVNVLHKTKRLSHYRIIKKIFIG